MKRFIHPVPAVEQDALNKAVQDGVQSLLSEQKLRPAMQPAVELDETAAARQRVISM